MKLGRYEILQEIGRGSMGVVYKAHDPNLDLVVALKVLREDRLADEAVARRFLAEAKALGRLEHPNTVRVYNVDREGGTVYIAMEFVEGESLSARMKRGRLAPGEIAQLGAAVAEALDDAHAKGIVHRDVKPGNLLLRPDGRVKITDFGIAHIEDLSQEDGTQAGEILGTPGYMSPEQVAGRPVDGRSDLFSLGIILYELATGAKPFAADTMAAVFYAIAHKDPEPPAVANPALPKALEQVILKCLAKRPEDRFATAGALAAALTACVAGPELAEAVGQTAPIRRRVPLPLAAAGGLLAVLAAAGGVYYARTPAPDADRAAATSAAAPTRTGALTIESSPAGAQLFVDGSFRGKAPTALTLAAGKHEIRVTLSGYYDWEAQVDVREATETPLSVELAPLGATR